MSCNTISPYICETCNIASCCFSIASIVYKEKWLGAGSGGRAGGMSLSLEKSNGAGQEEGEEETGHQAWDGGRRRLFLGSARLLPSCLLYDLLTFSLPTYSM